MLVRERMDRILHRVRRHDVAIVGVSKTGRKITFQPDAEFDLLDVVASLAAQNSQHPDALLAVVLRDQFHRARFYYQSDTGQRLSYCQDTHRLPMPHSLAELNSS